MSVAFLGAYLEIISASLYIPALRRSAHIAGTRNLRPSFTATYDLLGFSVSEVSTARVTQKNQMEMQKHDP